MNFELRDRDTICFVGDSITHNGIYHRIMADVFTLRRPERRVRWVNCGISGDSAGGALSRFDDDIAPHSPTQAFILFGMNDGNRGLYERRNQGVPGNAEEKARAIRGHAENVEKLAIRLREIGVRELFLLSPTVYDQYTRLEGSEEPCGYDDALAMMGESAHRIAGKVGGHFVDLHSGFLSAFQSEVKAEGKTSFVGEDRVHPVPTGHLLMATVILQALGVECGVSNTVAQYGGAIVAENAEICDGKTVDGRMEWMYLARSLPCVAPEDAWATAPAALRDSWTTLNREFLAVRGLPLGSYTLSVDGAPVHTASADEWANGVDMALVASPQSRQAAVVCRKRFDLAQYVATRVRNPRAARMFLMWDCFALKQAGTILPEGERDAAQALVDRGEGNPYVLGLYKDFLAHGNPVAIREAREEIEKMEAGIYEAAKIPARKFVLERGVRS